MIIIMFKSYDDLIIKNIWYQNRCKKTASCHGDVNVNDWIPEPLKNITIIIFLAYTISTTNSSVRNSTQLFFSD